VPFHGRTVRGWVLGPASEPPPGRVLPVKRVRSAVRFFDQDMLALLRWVSERYLAPLSTVIDRSHPPRVAGEERRAGLVAVRDRPAHEPVPRVLERYGGEAVLDATRPVWLRPLPDDEAAVCVDAVGRTLERGRAALVLVPEADPLPDTARRVLEGFGSRAAAFVGGEAHGRYRMWLDIRAGRFDVVVASRPGVFAPVPGLGLVWICRDAHPGHREERLPYYHVREVAAARAGLSGAACVLSSISPSVDVAMAASAGVIRAARPARAAERAAAPLVEAAPPEAEDRSVRLGSLLREARSAVLLVSRRGYGRARVCRTCGEPAACATCGGAIAVSDGKAACTACGSPGRCARCGGTTFGIERGGTERLAEWAARHTGAGVVLEREGMAPPRPGPGAVVVGTAAVVKDVGPARVDLVGILDPARALARPGIRAAEQALSTWMEAAMWAGPKSARRPGRVLAQTHQPGHPALQALIRWDPVPFLLQEAGRRADAGFPPGDAVFRLEGPPGLEEALDAVGHSPLLATTVEERTVCLLAVRPGDLAAFRVVVRRLVADGVVERVEAEPPL
jgi:primosomal protein N' (replication factor Y)